MLTGQVSKAIPAPRSQLLETSVFHISSNTLPMAFKNLLTDVLIDDDGTK